MHAYLRWLIIFCLFFTGFTGLVYEVTWHKYLANLIGSEARATALILGAFLGGLAFGYWLFGRLSRGQEGRALVKLCGWCEVGIGLWAFGFPSLYQWILEQSLTWQTSNSGLQLSVDLLTTSFLMLVPTALMGGTLPLLTQSLARSLADASRVHAQIYAVNTFGAGLGCLSAGFFIIPHLGLPLTVMYMGMINLLVGMVFVGVGRFVDDDEAASPKKVAKSQGPEIVQALPLTYGTVIGFLAGFYAIAWQTIVIRLTGLSMGSSEYAFAMVVAVFVYMLAVGAWRLTGRTVTYADLLRNQLLIFLSAAVVYVLVPYWPYSAHLLRISFSSSIVGFYAFHFAAFIALSLVLWVFVGAMGRTMPMLFAMTKDDPRATGWAVGVLYSVNTVGCIMGAIVGGYLLLYVFNLDQVFKICMLSVLLTILLLWMRIQNRPTLGSRSTQKVAAALVVAVGMVAVLPLWPKDRFVFGLFRQQRMTANSLDGAEAMHRKDPQGVLAYKDDPNTSVGVGVNFLTKSKDSPEESRFIVVNGKSDGSTRGHDRATTLLLGYLPTLLHSGTPTRVGVVGFGTGLTAAALVPNAEVSAVHVMEIAPAVKEFAPLFDMYNGDVSKNSKLVWHIGDAFRTLSSDPEPYDVLISEPSNPWVVGVERLYTQEFYLRTITKLRDNGIFAQWFHTYSMSNETLYMILNTIRSTFPAVRLFKTGNNDVVVLASKSPLGSEHVGRALPRAEASHVKSHLESIDKSSFLEVLAQEWEFPFATTASSGLHTLEFPKLSYRAGKNLFMEDMANIERLVETGLRSHFAAAGGAPLLWRVYFDAAAERDKIKILQSVVPGLCARDGTGVWAWQTGRRLCRGAVLYLTKNGVLDRAMTLRDPLLRERFDAWVGRAPAKDLKPLRPGEVSLAIEHYRLLQTPLTAIPPRVIMSGARACLLDQSKVGVTCQRQLVETLLDSGFYEEAKQVFESMPTAGNVGSVQKSVAAMFAAIDQLKVQSSAALAH